MRSRGQILAAVMLVVVVVGAGVFLQVEVGPRAPAAGGRGEAPSGFWLCPHGGGADWEATLEIANPGARAVDVRVRGLTAGKGSGGKWYTVQSRAELLIPVDARSRESSSVVEYFGGWVAAAWVDHAGGDEGGAASEPCLADAATRWLLPDGTTEEGRKTYVVLMNPFEANAIFTLTLLTPRRAPIMTETWTNVVLKPQRSAAFLVNAKALGESTVSTVVEAKVGRVAAATLVVVDKGGITSTVGYPGRAPARSILPGGFDQGRTDLVAMNAAGDRRDVAGVLYERDTEQTVGSLVAASLAGGSAQAFPVTTNGPSTIEVRAMSPGVAITRRTYGVVSDRASTAGAATTSGAWVVLPTVIEGPSHAGIVLGNPTDQDAEVTLTFLPSGATTPPDPATVRVPAHRTVAAPKAWLEERPLAAVLAIATTGTFVPASASYSLGREGYATYAVALGVPIPDAWVPVGP